MNFFSNFVSKPGIITHTMKIKKIMDIIVICRIFSLYSWVGVGVWRIGWIVAHRLSVDRLGNYLFLIFEMKRNWVNLLEYYKEKHQIIKYESI
jgi:hypothetical protein